MERVTVQTQKYGRVCSFKWVLLKDHSSLFPVSVLDFVEIARKAWESSSWRRERWFKGWGTVAVGSSI